MKVDLLDIPNTEEVRLEIVPLIDVIFCILTFFILAAVGLTRYQAIDLNLPQAETGEPLPPDTRPGTISNRLYISVDGTGQYYVGKQPVDLDSLEESIRLHKQYFPDGLVVLYAARDAFYEDVIYILDLSRREALEVSLATLPAEDKSFPLGTAEDFPELVPGESGDGGFDPSQDLLFDPGQGLEGGPALDPRLDPSLNDFGGDGLGTDGFGDGFGGEPNQP